MNAMSDNTDTEPSAPEKCSLCGDREATEAGFLIVNDRVFPHEPLCDGCSMDADEVVLYLEQTDLDQLQALRERGLLSAADEGPVDGGER